MQPTLTEKPVFAVLGAGNGGMAMAGHLALMGFEVRLFNRSPERLIPVRQRGGVQIVAAEGCSVPSGEADIPLTTTDIREALDGADIVMVVVPAPGHAFMAEQCAPHVRPGQCIVLHPGRTGGALEFHHVLGEHGVRDVVVAEAQTLLYACRVTNPAQVRVFGFKNSVPLAAIPAHRTPEVVRALQPAYREFVPGDNVMKTSLDNIGAIFHPAVSVLNSARIESTRGDFEYYIDGITRSTSLILEALDAERVAVGAAMGFHCMTAREWLYVAYGAVGKTLFEAIRANQGYYGIRAPNHVDHRYIWEDVPMSLVPIASLGEMFGVACPTMRGIIHMASLLHERDYWREGRTVDRMGLAGMSLSRIRMLVLEGGREEPGASGEPAQGAGAERRTVDGLTTASA